jgi:RNA polymerase sigma-70 factor (ECF subfamily)
MVKNRTNAEWLVDLSARGAQQTGALEDLRQLLLRAAQKTFSSYLGELQVHPRDAVTGLSDDCAQEALIAVLDHLEDFKGDSKFTTWAYKFAVNIALTTARRERQKFVPRDLTKQNSGLEEWLFQKGAKPFPDPEVLALKEEVWTVIRAVIQNDLTPRQREVMKLMVFDEVPMDEVVERLKTNRNAVYKLLHDGRRKIKIQLLARGIEPEDALSIFDKEK